ncbi:DedA family protein [Streptomyces anulatus]|uniref:DedA family protein n=1 Tax=Streptomyces anulatus TaxID=1892 RepID=UPI002257182D|nr:VTT domain-containing protein [Streptomyces anulatus]MCX4517996.1 VTT domain-containing protein [Streptomyces anulatus]MCX4600827.1 VTT domain-containing protein [Streptomyces anulatus]WSU73288.1 VTT domain-containing protein [Streptomyces anulatus]WTD09551.1 VTT domain-containing protein [Streptomyces anulatus]WTE02858.1 VTT domain-containing protein [Streptomyces anulatus]
MLESVGALTSSPWIYAVVALSVLLDVFLPLLPSGVLVITAATAAAAGTTTVSGAGGQVPSLVVLILCAASASVLGDLVAYRLAWRGGDRLDRAIARSRRLTSAQERLGAALSRGGGALVIIARFAPAGRSVVSLGAGAAHRRKRDFLPWSALAGLAWAGYSVGLGYFGGRWLGSTWFGTAVSVLALFVAGALAAFVVKRPATRTATTAEAEATETAPTATTTDSPVAGAVSGYASGSGSVSGSSSAALAAAPKTPPLVSVPAPTPASDTTSPGGSATLGTSGPVSAPAPAAP